MNDLYIMHYGVGHDKGGHSGRYPWGSGEEPYQDLSAAERRQKLLDKHWYHKGSKTRLGVDHIRDVDPNTKITDLFKYNKRTTSDVLADKILTYMYGDTEMSKEELRKKKYNLMSAITAAEAAAATAVLIGGLSSIKTGMNFAMARIDQQVANQYRYDKIIQEAKDHAHPERYRIKNKDLANAYDARRDYIKKGETYNKTLANIAEQKKATEDKNALISLNRYNNWKRDQISKTGQTVRQATGSQAYENRYMSPEPARRFVSPPDKNRYVDVGSYFVDNLIRGGNSDTKRALEEYNLLGEYEKQSTKDRLSRIAQSGDLRSAEKAQELLKKMG